MKLRIQPWFTHGCITFLNNVFKWYPQLCGTTPSVLEWGGGNSTLYFLTKKCNVLTVESDEGYVKELAALASAMGFRTAVVSNTTEAMERFHASDLVILHAKGYQDVGESIFQCRDWTFLVNDGISRKDVLEAVSRLTFRGVLILDNLEYCANWGRLERAAAHPDRVRLYRQFLRDPAWRQLLFEQQEGRNGHCTPDSTGWEAPHRWISGVLWRQEHLFTQLLVTHAGLPVVTPDALGDRDLETLSERCPFDWQQMKWLVDEYSNVFTLDRSFE